MRYGNSSFIVIVHVKSVCVHFSASSIDIPATFGLATPTGHGWPLQYSTYFIVVTWARVIYLICMPKARGLRAYISGKLKVPMLQLLCNTSGKADSVNANTNVTTGFYLYACLKDSIMVGRWSGIATFGKIN